MPSKACDTHSSSDRPARSLRRGVSWLRVGLTAILCVGGLSVLALAPVPVPQSAAPEADRFASALSSAWQVAATEKPFYEIESGSAGLATRREVRRQGATGLREDSLSLGGFETAASHVSLLLESGPMPVESTGLFVDLTRQAAPVGLAVLRMGGRDTLTTKFGEAEIAEVTLAGQSERACLAFRWADPGRRFGFKGWHCAADRAASRAQLACLIDRMTVSDAADAALRARFAQAEARRNPSCRPVRTAGSGRFTPRNTNETSRN